MSITSYSRMWSPFGWSRRSELRPRAANDFALDFASCFICVDISVRIPSILWLFLTSAPCEVRSTRHRFIPSAGPERIGLASARKVDDLPSFSVMMIDTKGIIFDASRPSGSFALPRLAFLPPSRRASGPKLVPRAHVAGVAAGAPSVRRVESGAPPVRRRDLRRLVAGGSSLGRGVLCREPVVGWFSLDEGAPRPSTSLSTDVLNLMFATRMSSYSDGPSSSGFSSALPPSLPGTAGHWICHTSCVNLGSETLSSTGTVRLHTYVLEQGPAVAV